MRWSICMVAVCASGLAAAELSEKWSKRLDSTEANYHTAVQKADNVRFYAIQKASQERVKALKSALTDATKAGDFDAATELKTRLTAAEMAGGMRAKPKNTVKFGGHEYALVEDKVTWHIAKRQCEEMGGHLATFDNEKESSFVARLCTKSEFTWVGATDEESEGHWHWVTGQPITDISWFRADQQELNHYIAYSQTESAWVDATSVHRSPFVCEWD